MVFRKKNFLAPWERGQDVFVVKKEGGEGKWKRRKRKGEASSEDL